MAKYTIRELYNFYTDSSRPVINNESFLGGAFWSFNPTEQYPTDTRPEYIKKYADVYGIDNVVVSKYGDWIYNVDCETVPLAWNRFTLDNEVFRITHNTELSMVYKAFISDYNPIENYDRIEDTTVTNSAQSGATTKVSPDDAEVFYNTGNAESSTSGSAITTSRVHGNIGVTRSDQMVSAVSEFYINNAYIDYFINRVINDNCFLVDDDIDII